MKDQDHLKRKGSLGALLMTSQPPTPPPKPPPKETKVSKARKSVFGLFQKAVGRGGKEEEEGTWGTTEELVMGMDPFGRGRAGWKDFVIGEP